MYIYKTVLLHYLRKIYNILLEENQFKWEFKLIGFLKGEGILKGRKSKVYLGVFYVLLFTTLFCGCGKEKGNTEFEQVSEISVLAGNTGIFQLPDLDKKAKLYSSVSDDLSVYFVQDKEQSILIQYQDKEAVFNWDYDLNLGKPLFYLTEKDALKLLYIALPTKENESDTSVEICGEWHMVRLGSTDKNQWKYAEEDFWMQEVLSADEAQEDFWMEWKEAVDKSYLVLHSGTKQEINSPFYEYPALQGINQENLEFVREDVLHITDSMLAYRRLGVRINDKIVWLGKLYDDLLIGGESRSASIRSTGRGCFVPDPEVQYGKKWYENWLSSGQMLALAPDCILDLDGDGIQERISYRMEEGNQKGILTVINQDGKQTLTEISSVGELDFRPFAVSLDGTTVQLVFQDMAGTREELSFYRKDENELVFVGEIVCKNYEYTVTGKTDLGNLKLSAVDIDAGMRLGNVAVSKDYLYEDGKLKEIMPEFYTILDRENYFIYPKTKLVLFDSLNGNKTIVFPERSKLRRVQCSELTDFPPEGEERKTWGFVMLENVDTGERGWIQMASVMECILQDSTVIECEKVFDGIRMAN